MLVIKNIKIQFERGVIPVRIRTLEVGYRKEKRCALKKYQQTDPHTFIWNEDITLPLYYNVPLVVVGRADQIQSNPEDPNYQLGCTIKIVDYRGSVQIGNLLNLEDKLMGTVALTYKVANQSLVIPQERGLAVISSILAHFYQQKGNTGFIQISMGNKDINTPTVSFVAGELLWADQLTLPVEEFKERKKQKHRIVFTIFIDDEPRGEGGFFIEHLEKSQIKYKKFDILGLEDKTTKLGTLFIDISFKDRQNLEMVPRTPHPSSLHKSNTNVLLRKKNTDSFINSKQPSTNFFHRGPLTVVKEVPSTPVKSSRSESKLLRGYNSQETAKVLQKFQNKQKRRMDEVANFDGIFKYGEYSNEQNIRKLMKQRRKKQKKEGSLPRLK